MSIWSQTRCCSTDEFRVCKTRQREQTFHLLLLSFSLPVIREMYQRETTKVERIGVERAYDFRRLGPGCSGASSGYWKSFVEVDLVISSLALISHEHSENVPDHTVLPLAYSQNSTFMRMP